MHAHRTVFTRLFAIACTSLAVALLLLPDGEAVAAYAQQNLVTDDQANLVASGYAPAAHVDPDLLNPWGISHGPGGPLLISNTHTGNTTLYDGTGIKQGLAVTVPPPAGAPPGSRSEPTGQVFNGSGGFPITYNLQTASSLFMFAGEDGIISGWNPMVNGTGAVVARDNSASEAIYKGLALGNVGPDQLLYATDFFNAKVDVFDSSFGSILAPGAFSDPNLPADFAPFGISNINGDLFISYAKQLLPDREDDEAGPGLGYIDVFHPDGTLVTRFASADVLNAPWGMALAPAGFGEFGGALLVGNFGDGRINAYDPATGVLLGHVTDANGNAFEVEGLWGLAFGDGVMAGDPNTLYFTAGINDEEHGLFGSLAPVPVPAALPLLVSAILALVGCVRGNRTLRA